MHLPKYPIYIISKGRWDTRMTQRTMEELKLPYRIVIEESLMQNCKCRIVNAEL